MTAIKICGITQPAQAAAIAPLVDYLGFNLWPRSKRHVTIAQAAELAAAARQGGAAKLVGLFVDATRAQIEAALTAVRFDVIQLHGSETPAEAHAIATLGVPVWKALSATPGLAIDGWPAAVLLDTPSVDRGGTGRTFDWAIATAARTRSPEVPVILAGGLDPENVAAAIAAVAPWAVDTASGVESAPGIKDLVKVRAFVAAAS